MDESHGLLHFTSGADATVDWNPHLVRVVVTGEVDVVFSEAGEAIVALLAGQERPVKVDLAGVTFFSAAGVAWLVELVREVPGGVQVVATSDRVRELLEVCDVLATGPGAGSASWAKPA
jgi:anti-anti-sigma factor